MAHLVAIASVLLISAPAGPGAGLGLTAQEQPPVVGYVSSLSGEWVRLGTPDPIRLGQVVRAGWVLRPLAADSPEGGWGRIVVVLRDGGLRSAECGPERRCSDLRVPAISSPSRWARIVDAVQQLFARAPGRYTVLGSRSGERLAEGVLKLDRGELDLGPVLEGLSPGDYVARLRPVEDEMASGIRPGEACPLPFSWEGGSLARVSDVNLPPGLYELSVARPGSARCASRSWSADAWVVLSGSDGFGDLAQDFSEAASLTRDWSAQEDRRAFLRAYLQHLAGR